MDNASRQREREILYIEDQDELQRVRVHAADGGDLTAALLARLGQARVFRVAVHEPTLEDAFLFTMSHGAASHGAAAASAADASIREAVA